MHKILAINPGSTVKIYPGDDEMETMTMEARRFEERLSSPEAQEVFADFIEKRTADVSRLSEVSSQVFHSEKI